MWEINNDFQIIAFLVSIVTGGCYCVLYDILRALRKIKKVSDFSVFIQDVLYFSVIALLTFFLMMIFANGEIRGYIILGIISGFIACFLTLSKFIFKFLIFVFGFLESIKLKTVNFLNDIIDKMTAFLIKIMKKAVSLLNNIKKSSKST